MAEPTDEDIDRRAREIFEAEKHKDRYWGSVAVERMTTADNTPLVLSDADRELYRDLARAELIKKTDGA